MCPTQQIERGMLVHKQNRRFIIVSLLPALLCFCLMLVYPVTKTIIQSFFSMKQIATPTKDWSFVGFGNYFEMFESHVFRTSLVNIGKIWLIGGLITIVVALLFAVILTSGVKGKSFWRSLIYLPNVISSVAMVNMWSLYVYNIEYGLLTKVLTSIADGIAKLGLDATWMYNIAGTHWTDGVNMFGSMLGAYCFGYIGYLMLIMMAGMEGIPNDLYESAYLDGATAWTKFWRITLPLIREVFRSCMMFWTLSTLGFFIWSQLWSRVSDLSLMTPMLYMYSITFTSDATGIADRNIGMGCAICVLIMLMTMVAYLLFNVILKERKYEY